ncbi:hypothetical protein SASPL_145633 [Salvia splendens]|uniref:Uncharacterized protein n=1 Tax=Salvia splendens TaxID=180675 RepID=A0A8X8Z8B4_SALSN|nr:hypothetical protein SASPL_145633 [Salvia splendens]
MPFQAASNEEIHLFIVAAVVSPLPNQNHSAAAARGQPRPILFLPDMRFGFSSANATVSSNHDNSKGQLCSKCLNPSDFITTVTMLFLNNGYELMRSTDYTPDGAGLASGGGGGVILVWERRDDGSDDEEMDFFVACCLKGHKGAVLSLVCVSDGFVTL